ncbi:hypothetical protein Micbo1qcDRAFT_200691 [Microdochium bolleyi]|uniref:Calcineurin-like phosphoesterase domain-containing protein n=1 Tax=Microdochium bolleyi TaxID=196109 RepID=A0A136JDM6_9PEZI|nr:hypothetical protein Micbo1qcDRAFT_200691 [Microdochium bolleyi]
MYRTLILLRYSQIDLCPSLSLKYLPVQPSVRSSTHRPRRRLVHQDARPHSRHAKATAVSFQIVSDLHLESRLGDNENPDSYRLYDIAPRAPYLALLGDIGCTRDTKGYLGFLRRHLMRFRIVFLVMGNHEPYHSTWASSRAVLRGFEVQIRDERAQEQQQSYTIYPSRNTTSSSSPSVAQGEESVTILGCTLFSHVPLRATEDVSRGLADFHLTGDGWDVYEHKLAFARDIRWLDDQKKGGSGSQHVSRGARLAAGFATDLRTRSCLGICAAAVEEASSAEASPVKLWAFGHTHHNCDFVDAATGIRFLANQKGYFHRPSTGDEGLQYDAQKVVGI